MQSDLRLKQEALAIGYDLEDEIKIGGNYAAVIHEGSRVYVSGQIPRVKDRIVVTGAAGRDITLQEAQAGARISAMRVLVLLQRALGSLDSITRILRVTVYVQSDSTFTSQSEVADAASDLFVRVLGPAGIHARTSVGVLQLPKNASVEIDLIAAVKETAEPPAGQAP